MYILTLLQCLSSKKEKEEYNSAKRSQNKIFRNFILKLKKLNTVLYILVLIIINNRIFCE